MQDRVPVNPGRVLVTPENGGAAYYATITRADNPTQEGTVLNKASLLKDTTAALFGLGTDAVPDDVLFILKNLVDGNTENANSRAKIYTGSYAGTNTYGASNPNTLTFDFEPKLVMIRGDFFHEGTQLWREAYFIRNAPYSWGAYYGDLQSSIITVTWGEKTLSWYASDREAQLNDSRIAAYYYVAIG